MTAKSVRCSYFKNFSINLPLIVLYFGLFSVFMMVMPKYMDDYRFIYALRPWLEAQGIVIPKQWPDLIHYPFPWDRIIEIWRYGYEIDNTRFGNLAVVIILMLPKWFGSGIMMILWTAAALKGLSLIGVDWRRSALMPVAFLLFTLLMPWHNHFACLDYQFNYIPATFFAVLLLGQLNRCARGGRRGFVIFLYALLAGGWHEGISIPLLAGLLALMIRFRRSRNKKFMIAVLGIVAGLLWIFLSPGQLGRAEYAQLLAGRYTPGYLVSVIGAIWPFLLLLGAVVGAVAIRRGCLRKMADDPRWVFILAGGLMSVVLVLVAYAAPRVGWWSSFSAIYGFIYGLRRVAPRFWQAYTRRNLLLCVPLLILVYVNLVMVDIYGCEVARRYRYGLERYVAAPHKSIFMKVTDMRSVPWICFGLPEPGALVEGVWGASFYYSNDSSAPLAFIPEELRHVTAASGKSIGGSGGLREYRGVFFREYDGTTRIAYDVEYDNGRRQKLCRESDFVSEADGRRYVYVHIYESIIDKLFGHQKHKIDVSGN